MAHSPQDIYARHLVSQRGYPLWTPEPNMNLPDVYVREGLKIGDVGVVVPEDGSFDVFFNLCLPPSHSLHRESGVPNNFTHIPLSGRDIAKFPEAESAGRIISTSSVARVRNTDGSDDGPARRAQPGPLNYEFTLSSQEGAVLILPEGAERYYLRNERLFLDEAIQHAVDWYTFGEQRLGRIISNDSLYLITGFYKARSWSLAAYQQGAGTGEASAQFKAVQVGRGNIAASYTWETTQAMDWRVGPSDQYYNGIPNQTVFIHGFKIAIREGILRKKRVDVKADIPSVRPYRVRFSGGSWFSRLLSGGSGSRSGSTASTPKRPGAGTSLNINAIENRVLGGESDGIHGEVMINRFPQPSNLKPFHPSDFINRYLLQEVPSASVAITHDRQWSGLLERGLLKPEEASQEDRLVAAISGNYILASREGAVLLESIAMDSAFDDSAMTASMSLKPWSGLTDPYPKSEPMQLSSRRKKRALLIAVQRVHGKAGSNYPDHEFAHRDAEKLRDTLIASHGYQADDIILMMDDRSYPEHLWPTHRRILHQIDLLISDAPEDCHFFFYFSGHGLEIEVDTEDRARTRAEGIEDVLCADGEPILDYMLHDRLVKPLEKVKGSKLFALFDCCHSETLLDLQRENGPNSYSRVWKIGPGQMFKDLATVTVNLLRLNKQRKYSNVPRTAARTNSILHSPVTYKTEEVDKTEEVGQLSAICLSACRDGQVTHDDFKQELTFTKHFMDVIAAKPNMTWEELRDALKEHISDIRTRYESTYLQDPSSEYNIIHESWAQEPRYCASSGTDLTETVSL